MLLVMVGYSLHSFWLQLLQYWVENVITSVLQITETLFDTPDSAWPNHVAILPELSITTHSYIASYRDSSMMQNYWSIYNTAIRQYSYTSTEDYPAIPFQVPFTSALTIYVPFHLYSWPKVQHSTRVSCMQLQWVSIAASTQCGPMHGIQNNLLQYRPTLCTAITDKYNTDTDSEDSQAHNWHPLHMLATMHEISTWYF